MIRYLMAKASRMLLILLIIPASAAAQAPISASASSISASGFTFRIAAVAFDETALGFVPPDMTETEQVMFVEFALLSGDTDDFKDLAMPLSWETGQKRSPVLLIADGAVKMLTAVTMKGSGGSYHPKEEHVVWVYVIPRTAEKFRLHFPEGEIVDLASLIDK